MEPIFIAIFIAWGILIYNYPRLFLVILSATFPLYLWKFSFYGIPFTFTEWLVYSSAVFLVLLKRKDILKYLNGIKVSVLYKRIDFWVLLFFVLSLISVFVSPVQFRNESFGILKGWIFAPILYFFIVKGMSKQAWDVRRYLDAYAFSAVVLSMWGIYQFINGFLVDNRATGPFTSANYLAFFIAPAFVYAGISAWQNIRTIHVPWYKKIFIKLFRKEIDEASMAMFFMYLAAALITGFSLIATNSYGAFIGVFFAFLCYGIYHFFYSPWKGNKKSAWQKIVMFAVLVILIFALLIPQLDAWKFKTVLQTTGTSSTAIRMETYEVALKMIQRAPVQGIGLGQFENVYKSDAAKLLGRPPVRPDVLHAHNLYLSFWLYTGILGLAVMLVILVNFFMSLKGLSDGKKGMVVILFSMMIVILVHGLVDTPFWKNDLAMQFFMILGTGFGLAKK